MNIAIVGFDIEGKATYEYFAAGKHTVTICDQNTELTTPPGVENVLGPTYLDNLDRFDMIVRTAGLHPGKILAKNPGVQDKITTHINEFLKVSPTKNIIGVTGTKGKGTTSSLITEMLRAAGKPVFLGGNIGVPPLSFLGKLTTESFVVLELSSFQLIDLKTSPKTAVCLMVEPEHLNWHEDFEEYIAAKQQLFIHQDDEDIAIYNAQNDNSISVADASMGHQIPYMESPGAYVEDEQIKIADKIICNVAELKLLGRHNWQNACAAVTAVWQITQDIEAIHSTLTSFTGLEHRLEFVGDVQGVSYYDDSFGTTPETAIVAIESFEQPKVVILGGSDKKSQYDKLARTVKNGNVRAVILIGETGPAIQRALLQEGYKDIFEGGTTMQQIISAARAQTKPGDVVLLSTGCASFDLFANYKDRGEQFKSTVLALPVAV